MSMKGLFYFMVFRAKHVFLNVYASFVNDPHMLIHKSFFTRFGLESVKDA